MYHDNKTGESHDLIDNSPYCLSYSAYDGRLENLVLDQLIIVDIK